MLNKSKGNMYSWITHTWNTVKGKCPHGCTYCYMTRWGKQNPARFDSKELKTDLGTGNFIFVGSNCDMFAKEIPEKWIWETLDACENSLGNRFLFQSKNPERFWAFNNSIVMSDMASLCTTIETNRVYEEIMQSSPLPTDRAKWMNVYAGFDRFVTIEPIMDFDLEPMIELIKRCEPSQVNIGADSGNNDLPEPPREKLIELIEALNKFTVISRKTNLGRLL